MAKSAFAESAFAPVIIVDARGADHWEVALTRGALWGRGVAARVVADAVDLGGCLPERTVVIFPGAGCPVGRGATEDWWDRLRSFTAEPHSVGATAAESGAGSAAGSPVVILAGYAFTLAALGGVKEEFLSCLETPPAPRLISIVGEPYQAVADLAAEPALLQRSVGRCLLGRPLDLHYYRTPAPEPEDGPDVEVPLLTSLGCLKRCGYCAQRPLYDRLYGASPAAPGKGSSTGVSRPGRTRRARSWPALMDDLETIRGSGARGLRLVADQFLSAEPGENGDLAELARRWRGRGEPLGITFTAGPKELLANTGLFESLAETFVPRPRLSIDSLSDETLGLLDLDFKAEEGLAAARYLAGLRVPFRVNYIFVRPGMTADLLERELRSIIALAETAALADGEAYSRLLMALDIFSRRLDVLPGSPLAEKGVPADYEKELPYGVLRAVAAAAETLKDTVDRWVTAGGAPGSVGDAESRPPVREHPVILAAEAGLRALR